MRFPRQVPGFAAAACAVFALGGPPAIDVASAQASGDLEQTMMGLKSLEAQLADGTAKAVGDVGVIKQLASTMVDFDPRFPIMPGTRLRGAEVPKTDAFQATIGDVAAE